MSTRSDATTQTSSAQPVRFMRGSREFDLDTFKLMPAEFQKNISWQKDQPRLQPEPHTHYYHSHDKNGRELTDCVNIGGHFHVMECTMDQDGNLSAKCGPPMRERTVRQGKRLVVVHEPVAFYSAEQGRNLVDNHRHEVQYVESKKVSANSIAEFRKVAAQELRSAMSSGITYEDVPKPQSNIPRLNLGGPQDDDVPMELG